VRPARRRIQFPLAPSLSAGSLLHTSFCSRISGWSQRLLLNFPGLTVSRLLCFPEANPVAKEAPAGYTPATLHDVTGERKHEYRSQQKRAAPILSPSLSS